VPLRPAETRHGQHPAGAHELAEPEQRRPGIAELTQRSVGYDRIERRCLQGMGQHIAVA
jgi:hypothetical protein